ncbi:hypothetical protein X777_07661 [Ooceraea biroi]|nr:hypothetical protein X777_07661 [Ooceraea biroi]
MATLKENWSQMRKGHASLSKRASAEMKGHHDYLDVLDEMEEACQTALDYMTECLEELEPPGSPANSTEVSFTRTNPSAFSLSHLPPIKLPPFDGKFDEWEQFRDRFQSLITENKDQSNFARMHFLTSCLKGRALDCIANLSITGDNFETAWRTLTSHFESKRRLLSVHLSTILNLVTLARELSIELQSLRDKIHVAVSALRNLERTPDELWNDILVHIVVQKLDPVTKKAWTVKTSDSDDPPKFNDLDRFLLARSHALEECSPTKLNSKMSGQKITASTATKTTLAACPLCKARHFLSACPTFTAGNPNQRRDIVKKHKRCFNCLSQSHSVGECQSKYSCRTCQQRHHSLLHDASDSRADSSAAVTVANTASPTTPPSPPMEENTVQSLCALAQNSRLQVLLATAWVTVGASSSRSFVVRALLDQGSEITFISERLAQNLRSKQITMPVSVSAVGGVSAGTFNKAVMISVSPRDSTTPAFPATALIMPHLTSYAPRTMTDLRSFAHLAALPWADSDPGSAETIDLILGADLYSCVILNGIRKGGQGDPIAQNTIWVGDFGSG